jgi:hypothetical protein
LLPVSAQTLLGLFLPGNDIGYTRQHNTCKRRKLQNTKARRDFISNEKIRSNPKQ